MIKDLLSTFLFEAISSTFNLNFVYEIRLRNNCPVVVNFAGKTYVVLDKTSKQALICTKKDITHCLSVATENSLYAFNNQIKQGFITCKDGLRLGLAGEHVLNKDNQPETLKNINSINIRIPHQIKNCAHLALTFMLDGGLKNTLIIAPPGAGKTTFLRDIAYSLSKINSTKILNVLIVDERFEIANAYNGTPTLDVGNFADVISGTTKEYAFCQGIRTLKPDVIICDELISKADAFAVKNAINSGVRVVATIHGENVKSVLNKSEFAFMIEEKLFERIIVLSNRNGPGTYENILNENLKPIYQACWGKCYDFCVRWHCDSFRFMWIFLFKQVCKQG